MSRIEELRGEVVRLVACFPEDVGEMRLRLEMHLKERGLPKKLAKTGFTVYQVMDAMTNIVYRDASSLLKVFAQEPSGGFVAAIQMMDETLLRMLRDALIMATFAPKE
ncbi:hypothetical protein KJ785_02675 [Patescibacteria group bacterium]|nr:hypothetical protein [Patescibacteria group bacterium]